MKTSELSGAALDLAVKKAIKKDGGYFLPSKDYKNISHSTDWAHGGPVIEQEGISLYLDTNNLWQANIFDGNPDVFFGSGVEGPTPLIAAMRCYVASKLGDEVEIPGEFQNA